MEDRIRSLCSSLLSETDAAKSRQLAIELRSELHKYIQQVRERIASFPLAEERRSRKRPQLNLPASVPSVLATTTATSHRDSPIRGDSETAQPITEPPEPTGEAAPKLKV